MPIYQQTPTWTRKPPTAGARINWANPVCQGLYYAVPFTEGSGTPHDIVQPSIPTVTGSPTWSTYSSGPAVNFSASTNYYTFPAWNPTTITLLVVVYGGTNNPGSLQWWGRDYDGTYVPWSLNGSAFGNPSGMSVFNGSAWIETNISSNPYDSTNYNDHKWHVVIGTADGANLWYYIDGIQQGTAAFSGNLPSSTDPVYLCQYVNNSYGFTGIMALALAWDRALSVPEVTSISANPWQVFQPRRGPWLWRGTTGVAAPSPSPYLVFPSMYFPSMIEE